MHSPGNQVLILLKFTMHMVSSKVMQQAMMLQGINDTSGFWGRGGFSAMVYLVICTGRGTELLLPTTCRTMILLQQSVELSNMYWALV